MCKWEILWKVWFINYASIIVSEIDYISNTSSAQVWKKNIGRIIELYGLDNLRHFLSDVVRYMLCLLVRGLTIVAPVIEHEVIRRFPPKIPRI